MVYLVDTNVVIRLRDGDSTIAAHALVHRATLVTRNAADLRDIAGFGMQVW